MTPCFTNSSRYNCFGFSSALAFLGFVSYSRNLLIDSFDPSVFVSKFKSMQIYRFFVCLVRIIFPYSVSKLKP